MIDAVAVIQDKVRLITIQSERMRKSRFHGLDSSLRSFTKYELNSIVFRRLMSIKDLSITGERTVDLESYRSIHEHEHRNSPFKYKMPHVKGK